MNYTFDGPNRLIILPYGTIQFWADDLYSRWKDWVLSGDGAAYPPALRSDGGAPIGGGTYAGSYFFLQTQDGWRIRPQESDHVLVVNGNLYPEEPGVDSFVDTIGFYRVRIMQIVSPMTQAMTTTGADPSEIAGAVWDESAASHVASGSMGALQSVSVPTPEAIADAVWDEPAGDHVNSGSVGKLLSIVGGLTPEQATQLLELWSLAGLDGPLITTPTLRSATGITQTITRVPGMVTVKRV